MEEIEPGQKLGKNRNANNNNSVFEGPESEEAGGMISVNGTFHDSKNELEMKNFAADSSTSVLSDGRRLESEEFENISISAVENVLVSAFEETQRSIIEGKGSSESARSEVLKSAGGFSKRRGSSFDSLKFEMAHEVIEEEELYESVDGDFHDKETEHVDDTEEKLLSKISNGKDDSVIQEEEEFNSEVVGRNGTAGIHRSGAFKEIDKTKRMEGSAEQADLEVNISGKPVSLKEHYKHLMETRRRSESAVSMCDKPADNYRKHSSGDLHSRLKTRKLLGVGETDDGDVHRSKLSQILGHSDQLYVRLPSGLRLWQIVLAVVFSVLSLWALVFPAHYFHAMYDMDGSSFTFPIRLYACALICISVMYWSTVQAADRDVIRMILLSSIIFFILQSCVLMSSWLPWLSSTSPASFLCSVVMAYVARLLVIAISSYYYWITHKDGKSKDVKYFR